MTNAERQKEAFRKRAARREALREGERLAQEVRNKVLQAFLANEELAIPKNVLEASKQATEAYSAEFKPKGHGKTAANVPGLKMSKSDALAMLEGEKK